MTAIACLTGAYTSYPAITLARTVVVVHELSPGIITASFVRCSVQCGKNLLTHLAQLLSSAGMHTIDVILNKLSRTDVGLPNGKWQTILSAILRVLREIDRLCHPEEHLLDEKFPGEDISPPLPLEHDQSAPIIHLSPVIVLLYL
ncbi:hypothetical protein BDB00DRAFT_870059 [Zychaea mexicana]|uniref:uncharacterized protein n=1 Tax=Zychaea mexicana TaxID=64656 RepID=UPI0022FEBBA5|nr:uncharacterized protein BDB00DRAFT_870059 [Zychaea mexicana]KAI9495836.1 hypothetical protein BDB00DRAFT_870059 [Zychaea mexicana]